MYRQPQKCKFIQNCWRRERKLWWCPLASRLDGERTSRRRISILRWHSDKFELDSNSSALYGKVQGKRSQLDNTMPTIVSNSTFITFFDIQQIRQMYYSATRGDLYAYIGFLDLRRPQHGSPVIRQVCNQTKEILFLQMNFQVHSPPSVLRFNSHWRWHCLWFFTSKDERWL